MKNRYGYVQYDEESTQASQLFKGKVDDLQVLTDAFVVPGVRVKLDNGIPNRDPEDVAAFVAAEHYKQLATDALEAFYMNVGKLIKTSQALRGGSTENLPSRNRS